MISEEEDQVPDIRIFFSYAREDKPLLIELKKHLQPLKNQGLINEWYDDTIISAGEEWQQEQANQLDSASIIALLISPDFLASDYTYNVEMRRAMQRHAEGKARVIPILLKPAHWEIAPFAKLALLPTNTQPITSWPDHNAAFLNVTRALSTIINDLQSQSSTQCNGSSSPAPSAELPGQQAQNEFKQSRKSIGTTLLTYDVHTKWVSSVAWSPDGHRIASCGGDGTVRIWNSETEQNLLTYRSHSNIFFSEAWDAQWSPDGRLIASCGIGVTVHVWETETGKDLVLYNHHMITNFMTNTYTLSWSPDGRSIASATGGLQDIDQTVHVWNAATGSTQVKYAGHASGFISPFNVSSIAWSPDGHIIASAGTDKTVKRWTLEPLKRFYTAQIWNAGTGQHLVTCNGSSAYIYDLSWSPDARYIATAESEGVIGVWDARSGQNILVYRGHTKVVRAVAWSPDGSRIASASNDHTVHIWRATTGELLYVYRGHTDNVATVAWSPDGKRIASAGSDSIVRIWQAV